MNRNKMFRFAMAAQKPGMPGVITPQAKIVDVAKRLGNNGIPEQQGTTRIIYDSLPLNGASTFRFFEGSGSRQFPFTNLDGTNGQLGVGETMVLERAYFLIFERNPITGEINSVANIAVNNNLVLGEMNFIQANSQIVKRLKLSSFAAQFNKDAQFATYAVFGFDTDLTIQPQLEFVCEVRTAAGITLDNTFLQLVLEGTGSIISPKQNF